MANIIGLFSTQNELLKSFPKTKNYQTKELFEEYWDDFSNYAEEKHYEIRPVVSKEIDKMLKCKTPELGYSVYKCPKCGNEAIVHNTCKSRICSSCGLKYAKERTQTIMEHLYNCRHRHITFTIPSILCPYFRKDRSLLNLLFQAVNEVLSSFFKKIKKKENYKGGYILVLHTFGRDNKWNTHIHALVAEMAMGDITAYKKVDFFPFELLRKSFQTVLLNLMEQKLGKENFRDVKNKIYKNSNNGFYVRAIKEDYKDHSPKKIIEYVLRYCGRPAFASYRILDISNNTVTFWYQRHEDNKFIVEGIHVFELIARIIIHIPEFQFKTIRYYGFYNKKHKFCDMIKMLLDKEKIPFYRQLNTYRMLMLKSFDIDPLICNKCGTVMEFEILIC